MTLVVVVVDSLLDRAGGHEHHGLGASLASLLDDKSGVGGVVVDEYASGDRSGGGDGSG